METIILDSVELLIIWVFDQLYKCTLYHEILLKYIWKWQTYAVSTKTATVSQHLSIMQHWLQANRLIGKKWMLNSLWLPVVVTSSNCSSRSLRPHITANKLALSRAASRLLGRQHTMWKYSPHVWLHFKTTGGYASPLSLTLFDKPLTQAFIHSLEWIYSGCID